MYYYDLKTPSYSVDDICLNGLSAEEQVLLLKNYIKSLEDSLRSCIEVVKGTQDDVNYICRDLQAFEHELTKHTNSFHAILIGNNKKGDKDESNIS